MLIDAMVRRIIAIFEGTLDYSTKLIKLRAIEKGITDWFKSGVVTDGERFQIVDAVTRCRESLRAEGQQEFNDQKRNV